MRRLIHLSDLHIGKCRSDSFQWSRLMLYIARTHPGVPVLITGDITHSGREEEFEMAQGWIGRLASNNPVLMVPGNHDYAFHGFLPFHSEGTNLNRWYEYCGVPVGFGERKGIPNLWMPSEPVFEGYGRFQIDDKLMAFYVDSGDPERRKSCAKGWISAGMCAILAKELPKYADFTRVVMLHHHPFNHSYHMGLQGWRDFMSALTGNCELLLFGHNHHYGVWRQDDTGWEIPCIVASHRSLRELSGGFGAITVIDITDPGTPQVEFRPVLEMVDFA